MSKIFWFSCSAVWYIWAIWYAWFRPYEAKQLVIALFYFILAAVSFIHAYNLKKETE